jgi:transcription antitermination factor NusG
VFTTTSDEMTASTAVLLQPQWFAVLTRPRHEKMVAAQLDGRGIEHFVPLITQERRWSDRRKRIDMPLFPGYAFVKVPHSSEHMVRVLRAAGVLRFVGFGQQATPIPEAQIVNVQLLLANDVRCDAHPFLRVGQRVKVRGGCLEGLEGILIAKDPGKSLVVSIDSIERSLSISLDGYSVEPI